MRTLKINILFIFILGYTGSAITLPAYKRVNFVAEENFYTAGVFASNLIKVSDFKLIKSDANKTMINPVKICNNYVYTNTQKHGAGKGIIQKIIKSNLKLSFRLKCNMNLIITYQ